MTETLTWTWRTYQDDLLEGGGATVELAHQAAGQFGHRLLAHRQVQLPQL